MHLPGAADIRFYIGSGSAVCEEPGREMRSEPGEPEENACEPQETSALSWPRT